MNHYFAAITGRDSLGVWKPDRGHILGTVRLASGDAARTIMIGDSETDIMAAKNAGVPVVALTFGYSTEPVETFAPDKTVTHWRDVRSAIDAIVASQAVSARG
jgi:phosphoglycolate phosphatase